jgi:hypothetical protein
MHKRTPKELNSDCQKESKQAMYLTVVKYFLALRVTAALWIRVSKNLVKVIKLTQFRRLNNGN